MLYYFFIPLAKENCYNNCYNNYFFLSTLEISDQQYSTFYAFLKYLYTDKVSMKPEDTLGKDLSYVPETWPNSTLLCLGHVSGT